jgi:hypothetical protein
MSQNAKQLQHVQFYFVISGLKIAGHGNPDTYLESHSENSLKNERFSQQIAYSIRKLCTYTNF